MTELMESILPVVKKNNFACARTRCTEKSPVAVGLCLVLLISCGYRFVGSTNTIPSHIKRISVKPFQNATTEYKIEQHITSGFVRELISRTRYNLVHDETKADAILHGTVLNFLVFPVIFDPRSGRATSVSTITQIQVVLRDRRSGEVIYDHPSFEHRESYEVSTSTDAYFEEREAALIRTSQNVARDLVSAVLSGF